MNSTSSTTARLAIRLTMFGALSTGTAIAVAAVTITDGELEVLPDYCRDAPIIRYGTQFYNKSPRADYWVGLMGETFWAMHHYCWALTNLRRVGLLPSNSPLRKGMLEEVRSDYFFVINNAKPGFVLLPEIWLRIGEVELMLGNITTAMEALEKSRTIKPDYWPAYTRWIDVLLKLNKTADAKALAAQGLRFAPGSTELAKRYRKLGGDPTTIVPAVPAGAADGRGTDASTDGAKPPVADDAPPNRSSPRPSQPSDPAPPPS